jgi:hypothetical protein
MVKTSTYGHALIAIDCAIARIGLDTPPIGMPASEMSTEQTTTQESSNCSERFERSSAVQGV